MALTTLGPARPYIHMPITLPELRRFAENSVAFRLMRVVEDMAFLEHAFRTSGAVVLTESELRTDMARWLQINFEEDQDKHPGWKPAERIALYVKQQFLRKRELAERSEPIYELTSDADRFLAWIEDQRRRDFVGTEYGLQAIMRDLKELAAKATGDWQKRLDSLKARRAEIDKEIEGIYAKPEDDKADTRYVMETLRRLERASQDLVSDFSILRERFSDLARDIARQHGSASTRRGDVLRLALDGEDALRNTPMGESFHGFWRLVASSEREEFMRMVESIYATPELPEEVRERRSLESLLDALREQGQVVLDANRQLTRQLRRALDREEIETRRLMAARMSDIRLLMLGHAAELEDLAGIEVDEPIRVGLPMERPIFDPPEPVVVDTELKPTTPADLRRAAEQIAEAGVIDFKRLLANIQDCLDRSERGTGVLLSTVIEVHPPKEGLLDLLGYLHLGRLLGEDAQVMEQTFPWESDSGRGVVCPDVFFISVGALVV